MGRPLQKYDADALTVWILQADAPCNFLDPVTV
jgi:hypothetical protein